jgi:hypothetical protein
MAFAQVSQTLEPAARRTHDPLCTPSALITST